MPLLKGETVENFREYNFCEIKIAHFLNSKSIHSNSFLREMKFIFQECKIPTYILFYKSSKHSEPYKILSLVDDR